MRKMNTWGTSSILKITLATLLSVSTFLTLPNVGSALASPIINVTSGARTAPPPPEPSNHMMVADSKHIYQAIGAVTPGGGLSAIINTSTTTFKEMKILSVNYRLERWTGTAWVTYKSESKTASKARSLNAESDCTVIPGYYYRVISVHTANDGTVSETKTHTSNNVLF
ncbi:hypothetical protein C0Q44_18760 [Paenibacillus sp. PCH8]|uniref:hypothetical protein n=1 Tax=Paenibacillus sp. PCH8 TaxID=2066524 RepID=UPI000CFA2CF9|nr:hypothetical protein [Paenibacillus sp. PCH8]PQP81732.1 hypothetical protein C0Q44_18760 [Paenibacillus sp. PCH8]